MNVAVVTDSTSDLDTEIAAEYGIDVVPVFVNFGNTRFRDGVDLTRDEFYRRMREGRTLPTTSQPTPEAFERAYEPHVRAGRAIVSIHVAQKLSGTINAARAAAAQFPDAPIHLVDSGQVTAGLALLVLRAATLARDGAPVLAVIAGLERERAAVRGYVTLPDLSHAVRGGRISPTMAALGNLLKIVPVLRVQDGAVEVEARVRTFARAQTTIVDAAVQHLGDVERASIIVMHAHAVERGRTLLAALRERLPGTPAYLELGEAGPAIATHAGEGAVGIFAVAG